MVAEGLPRKSSTRAYLTPIRYASTTEAAAADAVETADGQQPQQEEGGGEPAAPDSKQSNKRYKIL